MALHVPLRALRVANPLVRVVLRSRAHRLFSGRLLLLSYRGHRSGRTFSIPLRYAETTNGVIVAVAVRPEQKLWWRSFRSGCDATLTLRRRPVGVRGALLTGGDRDAARAAYVARYPRSERIVRGAAIIGFDVG